MYKDRKGIVYTKPAHRIPKKRESAYGIYIQEGRILLVKPVWLDVWEFPGGGKDPDENIYDALTREFFEETGYEVTEFDRNPVHVLNMKFYADDIDEYFDSQMSFFMIQKIRESDKKTVDTSEIVDMQYMLISELNAQNMRSFHFDIVENRLNGQYSTANTSVGASQSGSV